MNTLQKKQISKIKEQPIKKARVNIRNILGFIQGYVNLFRKTLSNWVYDDWKREQIIWRRLQARRCMANEECIYCGCEMIGKTMEDRGCSNPDRLCYPDMMDRKTWDKYKNRLKIKIFK
jgi:hypothetical protein